MSTMATAKKNLRSAMNLMVLLKIMMRSSQPQLLDVTPANGQIDHCPGDHDGAEH